MEMGRQRGGLDIDDIRRALPVDAMSIEELADVLARLEEAGIPVEIDSVLLTPRHPRMPLREVKPTTEPSRHSERTTAAQDRLTILASSIKAARENSYRTRQPTLTFTEKSGTIFVAVAALILFLLTLGIWRWLT
jgi:hypothetical protein